MRQFCFIIIILIMRGVGRMLSYNNLRHHLDWFLETNATLWSAVHSVLVQVTVLGISWISNKSCLRCEDFNLRALSLDGVKGPPLAEWVLHGVVANSWGEAGVWDRHQAAVRQTAESCPSSSSKQRVVSLAELSVGPSKHGHSSVTAESLGDNPSCAPGTLWHKWHCVEVLGVAPVEALVSVPVAFVANVTSTTVPPVKELTFVPEHPVVDKSTAVA